MRGRQRERGTERESNLFLKQQTQTQICIWPVSQTPFILLSFGLYITMVSHKQALQSVRHCRNEKCDELLFRGYMRLHVTALTDCTVNSPKGV